jgi:hypothetical protein
LFGAEKFGLPRADASAAVAVLNAPQEPPFQAFCGISGVYEHFWIA